MKIWLASILGYPVPRCTCLPCTNMYVFTLYQYIRVYSVPILRVYPVPIYTCLPITYRCTCLPCTNMYVFTLYQYVRVYPMPNMYCVYPAPRCTCLPCTKYVHVYPAPRFTCLPCSKYVRVYPVPRCTCPKEEFLEIQLGPKWMLYFVYLQAMIHSMNVCIFGVLLN